MNKTKALVSIKDVSCGYGGLPVIEKINLQIQTGEYIALSGPNGAGKTTLLQAMIGLLSVQKGRIKLFDQSLQNFNQWSKIGYVPQRGQSFNRLMPATVGEVVEMGLSGQKSQSSSADQIDLALKKVDLQHLAKKRISQLSGGQQQRVLLARALVGQPELLLLDEPSTALDVKSRTSFYQLLENLYKNENVTVVLVTHDTAQVSQWATRLIYIDKQVLFDGNWREFCLSKKMKGLFGTSQHLLCRQHEN